MAEGPPAPSNVVPLWVCYASSVGIFGFCIQNPKSNYLEGSGAIQYTVYMQALSRHPSPSPRRTDMDYPFCTAFYQGASHWVAVAGFLVSHDYKDYVGVI